jgi:predicted outer membrane repeat protein
MNRKFAATALCSLLMGLPATADTIHVQAGGDIHEAIKAASSGDVIQLGSGNYFLSYPLNTLGKDIVLQGAVPPPNVTRPNDTWPTTTIHSTGPWPVLHVSAGESPVFQYLAITDGVGYGGFGGGLEVDSGSSPEVNACSFEYNYAGERGGAIAALNGSSVTVSNSYLAKNASMNNIGGAVYSDKTSSTVLVSSVICGNIMNTGACSQADSQLSGSYTLAESQVDCLGCDANPSGDLNHDGFTDGGDLTVLLSAWGQVAGSTGACCFIADNGVETCSMTYQGQCEDVYGGTFYPETACGAKGVACGSGSLASSPCVIGCSEFGACCYVTAPNGNKACKFETKGDCLVRPTYTPGGGGQGIPVFFPGVTSCSALPQTACQTGAVQACCGCSTIPSCQYLPTEVCTSCTNPFGQPGCTLPAGVKCGDGSPFCSTCQ